MLNIYAIKQTEISVGDVGNQRHHKLFKATVKRFDDKAPNNHLPFSRWRIWITPNPGNKSG